jgi:hypothetical protein
MTWKKLCIAGHPRSYPCLAFENAVGRDAPRGWLELDGDALGFGLLESTSTDDKVVVFLLQQEPFYDRTFHVFFDRADRVLVFQGTAPCRPYIDDLARRTKAKLEIVPCGELVPTSAESEQLLLEKTTLALDALAPGSRRAVRKQPLDFPVLTKFLLPSFGKVGGTGVGGEKLNAQLRVVS